MKNEFCIGIPVYSKENLSLISFALTNLGNCLAKLNEKPSIVIAVNGPEDDKFRESLKKDFPDLTI